MIKINNFTFTLIQVAKSNEVLITEVKPYRDYIDDKPSDKVAGYKYTVVCSANKFESFAVKIAQENPTITAEQIEAAGGTIKATFKGFEGKFYRDSRSGEYMFTSKANELEVLKRKNFFITFLITIEFIK